MSEQIKLWGIAICSAAMIAGIINSLLPSGSLGKIAKYVLGIYLTVVLIKPFLSVKEFETLFDVPEYETTSSYENNDYDSIVLCETKEIIEKKIEGLLNENGIYLNDIDIDINIDEKNDISFVSIELFLSEEYSDKSDEILYIVKKETRLTPKINFK